MGCQEGMCGGSRSGGYVVSFLLTFLGSMTSKTAHFLVRTVGDPEWLQGLLGCLEAPTGPVARE